MGNALVATLKIRGPILDEQTDEWLEADDSAGEALQIERSLNGRLELIRSESLVDQLWYSAPPRSAQILFVRPF